MELERNALNPRINGALHAFLDRNYFRSQAASIRRLTDKHGVRGPRAVYSLHALIKDLKTYRVELTRQAYFRLSKQAVGKAFFVPPEFDSTPIAEAHANFDRLSGRRQADRKPDDVIAERVFDRAMQRLDPCQQIVRYVDKFVAHSASPESRESQNPQASELTFRQLWDAQQAIFEVANFLSIILFSADHVALAIENPRFFEHWAAPLLEGTDASAIRGAFANYRTETEQWRAEGFKATWRWIEARA
jgi:hypothetical protein